IEATLAKQFKVTISVDGKTGWQQQPTQSGAMQTAEFTSPKDINQAQFEVWRDPDLILLKATDKDAKVTPGADDTIDGKPHAVVRLASPFGPEVSIYIDKKTKMVSRIGFSDGGVAQSDDFSDYKDSQGIKVAFKRSSTGQGRTT